MKALPALLMTVFLMGGCAAMKPNPEFSSCSNKCTKKQDACMVNASTSDDVARCNAALDRCMTSCEAKYPRWIKLDIRKRFHEL